MSNKQEMVTIPKKYLERLWKSYENHYEGIDELNLIKQDDRRFYRAIRNAGLVTSNKKNSEYKRIREQKQLAKAFFDREFGRIFLTESTVNFSSKYGGAAYGLRRVKIVGRSPDRTKLRMKFVDSPETIKDIPAVDLRLVPETHHVWEDNLKLYINKTEIQRIADFFNRLDPNYFDELEIGL